MKHILALLLLLTSQVVHADYWDSYHNADHFQWTDYNDLVHLFAGYTISTLTTLTLQRHFKVKRNWAIFAGFVAGAAVGVAKETFTDTYTSRTDIKMWTAGSAAASLTFIVLRF